MSFFKVNYKGRVLIDLSEDSVSPENLYRGIQAHDNKGNLIIGSANTYEQGILDGRAQLQEELPVMIQEHLQTIEGTEYYSSDEGWLLEETNKYLTVENISEILELVEQEDKKDLSWQGVFAFSNKNTRLSLSLVCDIETTILTPEQKNYLSNVFSVTIELGAGETFELNMTEIVDENTQLQDLEGYTSLAQVSIIGIKWSL